MAIIVVTYKKPLLRKEVTSMAVALKRRLGHPVLLDGEPIDIRVRRLGRREHQEPGVAIRITANQQRHCASDKLFIEDVVFALACEALNDWRHPVSVELQDHALADSF